MARRRNAKKKIVIELEVRGDVDAAAEKIDNLFDSGSIQDVIESSDFDEDYGPVKITRSKVFIEE